MHDGCVVDFSQQQDRTGPWILPHKHCTLPLIYAMETPAFSYFVIQNPMNKSPSKRRAELHSTLDFKPTQ
jgi:hypothetical protein